MLKNILMLFLAVFMLSACADNNESSNTSEKALNIVESSLTKEPEHGDVFLIQLESGVQIIYAHVEKDTEVTADEEEDMLNIYFEEPGESDDLMLHSIEVQESTDEEVLNVYINDEEVSVEVLHE